MSYQEAIGLFWATLAGSGIFVMLVHLSIKRLLLKKFVNPVKAAITTKLVVVTLPFVFLMLLSILKFESYLNSPPGDLPRIIILAFKWPMEKIAHFSNTLWPSLALGGIMASIILMYAMPVVVEKSKNNYIKFLAYSLLSFGLYLPYRLFSYLFEHSSSEKLRRGTPVIHSSTLALQTLRKKVELKTAGIKIHPKLHIPLEFETKHFLTVATIGAGKTQIIFPMVKEIKKRGDRMLIYDRKGDYTEAFGEDNGTIIISPFDERAFAWDIGRDISSDLLAEEFASALIPRQKGADSVWIEAAQDVLTGVIKSLQKENPADWGFVDLSEILQDKNKIIRCCELYHQGALQNLGNGGDDDRQTTSVLLTLRTAVKRVEHLAKAWGKGRRKISLVDWISNDQHEVRSIIIGGNPRYSGLDNLIVTQIFNLIYSEILSLPDSRTRRIWTINDEQGSQPRIPMMLNGLTEGRSKGLRIISAVQSVSQIQSVYGKEKAEEWFNSFGTLFAGRVGDSVSASFLAKAFGINRIEKISTSVQQGDGRVSRSLQRSNDPALLDSDFLAIPNPTIEKGIEFWIRVAGWPASKLVYPIKATEKNYQAKQQMGWLMTSNLNT